MIRESDMKRAKIIAAAALALGCLTGAASAEGQKLLSIVTATDTEAQAMAFVLANQSLKLGGQPHILLCGPAGDVALATASAEAQKVVTPNGMSARSLLEALIANGGKVDVCAIYLPNRKLGPDALLKGVGVAKPQEIAAEMLDPAVKLIGN